MLKNLLSVFCAVLCLTLSAQQQAPRRFCGNEYLLDITEQRLPGYRQAVQASFDQAKRRQAQVINDTSIYVIPIAFHILWNGISENLDDSVLYSQLDVLNEDYRRHNADSANTISYFDTVAGDAHIQFVIHAIRRVQTSNTFTFTNGFPDPEIKYYSNGGDDAIAPAHYLNIWIVNLQASLVGQLFGYSYPPDSMNNWPGGSAANDPSLDGVVLDYRCVGRNNPNPIYSGSQRLAIVGRTATHEIGHYFGLRHIWGDGSTMGPNNCLQSDGIDDTPFSNAATNFDCNLSNNTCHQIEAYYHADAPDMVQNYMDYSAETCSNLFTKGQIALMRGVLADQRQSLLIGTGIKDMNASTAISVYPNPSSGVVTVSWEGNSNADAAVDILNVLGENVYVAQMKSKGSVRLDMSAVPNGVYMIDIRSEGRHSAQRVVLSR